MEEININDKWLIVYQGTIVQYRNDYKKSEYNNKLVLVTGKKDSVNTLLRDSYLCVSDGTSLVEILIPATYLQNIQVGADGMLYGKMDGILQFAQANGINISFTDGAVTIGIDDATLAKINSIDNKVEQTAYNAKVAELAGAIESKYTKPVGGIPVKDLVSEVATETEVANAISKVATVLNDKIDSKVGNADLKNLTYTVNGVSKTFNGLSEATIPQIFTPTQVGSQGQILQSMGGGAPQWKNLSEIKEAIGFAKDLTGVIEATPEEFTFRPSAGDKSIRDESAVIRRIKGNTTVWGQLANINASFSNSGNRYDITRNTDGSVTIKRNPSITSGYWCAYNMDEAYRNTSHKYMFYADVSVSEVQSSSDYCRVSVYNLAVMTGNHTNYRTDGRHTFCCFGSPNDTSNTWQFAFYVYGVAELTIHNLQCFDLTQIFGDGNEPTTLEEFKKVYPESYYPYCVPEIRSMQAWGIEMIGANAFDKDYVFAGTINADGTITSSTIYSYTKMEVVPNERYALKNVANTYYDRLPCSCALYDSNDKLISVIGLKDTTTGNKAASGDVVVPINARYMYVVVHNDYLDSCCVNLRHSGTLNDSDATYFKEERALPEIADYFPDGMNSVGEVYDEINAEYAIQRCAMRTYNNGDEDNDSVRTDMTNTVYILDEPIVKPIIEPLQLDYKVADFGTEKALTAPNSSPFRADIVYQFNAEGRIRDNGRNIERIEAQMKNLATRDFVIEVMPTEVAEATQLRQFTSLNEVSAITPNIMYEFASGFGENAIITLPQLYQPVGEYDHVWMLRFPSIANSNSLQYPYTTIKWKDSTPPTFVTACTLEIYFKKDGAGAILGEWKIYR